MGAYCLQGVEHGAAARAASQLGMTSASPGFSRPIDADPASIPSVVARFSVIFREFDAYSLNVYLIDLITAKLKFCNKVR
jgi:hypothetical protein